VHPAVSPKSLGARRERSIREAAGFLDKNKQNQYVVT
jgi:hypothetical protein